MGCFSYLCQECGQGILSDSTSTGSEKVRLTYIVDGKTVEEKVGIYNSYGGVFAADGESYDEWDTDWSDIVDHHFDGNDGNGISAVHSACDHGEQYTTISEDDPNQGWGSDQWDEEDYDDEEEFDEEDDY